MKTGWKIVLIAAAIIAGIGVILGCISLLIGGSFQSLAESPAAETLAKLSPTAMLQFVAAFFGG